MAKKSEWKTWLTLFVTAALFAVVIGNVIFFFGADYQVPGIHLDLLTFVSLFGYGVITFIVAFIFRRK
jgi:hypothetical protein